MKELIYELCSANGVSGRENSICQVASNNLKDIAKVYTTNMNSIIAECGNLESEYTILLDAHIDQIGLVVTYIDEKGFIKANACGGIDRRVIQGEIFKILGKKDVEAVACCLPPHLTDGNEDKAIKADDLWFDTGLPLEKVKELISLGDTIVFDNQPMQLINNRISSKALDNRAGVTTLIEVAKRINNVNLNCKVVLSLSSQEEVSFTGAKTSTFSIEPNEAIVVDVSFATQENVSPMKSGEMGKGAMIGVGTTLDKDITNKLIEISKKHNIDYQLEILAGATGTNADTISSTKKGVKTGMVSIPLKNMHTQCEIIDMYDIECVVKIISEYIVERSATL